MEEIIKLFKECESKTNEYIDNRDKKIFEYFGQEFNKDKILILNDKYNIDGINCSQRVKFSKHIPINTGYICNKEINEIYKPQFKY